MTMMRMMGGKNAYVKDGFAVGCWRVVFGVLRGFLFYMANVGGLVGALLIGGIEVAKHLLGK